MWTRFIFAFMKLISCNSWQKRIWKKQKKKKKKKTTDLFVTLSLIFFFSCLIFIFGYLVYACDRNRIMTLSFRLLDSFIVCFIDCSSCKDTPNKWWAKAFSHNSMKAHKHIHKLTHKLTKGIKSFTLFESNRWMETTWCNYIDGKSNSNLLTSRLNGVDHFVQLKLI